MFGADAAEQVMTRVAGLDSNYHCPDTQAVEAHIVAIRARIAKAAGHAPLTVERLRHDIDLLLGRWLYLRELED